MDPINTAVTALISSFLAPIANSTIGYGKDVIVKRWARWGAVVADLEVYANECENALISCADQVQGMFLSCFESGSPESQQAKRLMSAGRWMLNLPWKSQKLDTEWEELALTHLVAPATENPLFEKLKDMMEVKMKAFVTAYHDEMLNYAKNEKVSRETLLLEKASVMEIWHFWADAIKQLMLQVSNRQMEISRDLRLPENPGPTLSADQVQSLIRIEATAVSAIDGLFTKMIDRISMAD